MMEMNIIKVIVDEVPEHCTKCRYLEYKIVIASNNSKPYCHMLEKYWDDNYVLGRPPRCPLVDNFMTLDEFQAALDE